MEKSPRNWQKRRANSPILIGVIPCMNSSFKSMVLKAEEI